MTAPNRSSKSLRDRLLHTKKFHFTCAKENQSQCLVSSSPCKLVGLPKVQGEPCTTGRTKSPGCITMSSRPHPTVRVGMSNPPRGAVVAVNPSGRGIRTTEGCASRQKASSERHVVIPTTYQYHVEPTILAHFMSAAPSSPQSPLSQSGSTSPAHGDQAWPTIGVGRTHRLHNDVDLYYRNGPFRCCSTQSLAAAGICGSLCVCEKCERARSFS